MDSIYIPCTLTRKVTIPIHMIKNNLEHTLHETILKEISGKCMPEGFVNPGTIRLLTYTCGTVHGNMVVFTCLFTCSVANPVEGQLLKCVIENVTKAGLKCRLDASFSPCVIFVARDHHYMDEEFNKKKIHQKITVKVIGQRFELNDKFISVIGSVVTESPDKPDDEPQEEEEPPAEEPPTAEPQDEPQDEPPADEPQDEPPAEPQEEPPAEEPPKPPQEEPPTDKRLLKKKSSKKKTIKQPTKGFK